MNVQIRDRRPPDPMWPHYKENARRMRNDDNYRAKIRDRAAFIHVTGIYPSHLRRETIQTLRYMVETYQTLTALDGRSGQFRVHPEVVADLELNAHPMVRKVREKMREGYFIQGSRGFRQRRNFGKVYMFKLNADGIKVSPITVKGDGSIKDGW